MAQLFEGQIRFGIHSGQQHTDFADYLELWKMAEDLGYDWASVFDHFMPIQSDPEGPCFEGLTLLAAMAAHTERIRCGILVIGNTYRNPAVLANIATTIDHISGGRLELGVGAGWYEMEHEQYGIPFHTTARRIRALGESVQIMKSLWKEQRTTFEGRYYQLENALSEPKPLQQPSIPLWIGGAGEQLTLRVVAESADGWNTFFMPPDEYRHKLDVLEGHCKAVGRSIHDVRKSLVIQAVVAETEAEIEDQLQRMSAARNTTPEELRQRAMIGTPEQCIEQLLPYVEMGVGDFIIGARPPADYPSLELIAKQIAPEVKARGADLMPKG